MNGYGAANMQCAARATAHREPLGDGKLEDQLMTAFGKLHRSVPSAVQGPLWAVRVIRKMSAPRGWGIRLSLQLCTRRRLGRTCAIGGLLGWIFESAAIKVAAFNGR